MEGPRELSGKAGGKATQGTNGHFPLKLQLIRSSLGFVLSTLVLDKGNSEVICVALDTFFSFRLLHRSETFHRCVEIKANVFPQLGSLPLFYLFAVYSKNIS